MASKDNGKKAMDVAKPGKPAPDTSGRPVLVTHRPIVQDPMVNQASEPDLQVSAQPKKDPVSHSTKTLQPIDESLKPEVKKEPEAVNDESDAQAAAEVKAVAEQAETKRKTREGEISAEDKAKQEHIQKLTADKTYFVPVGQVARRRNRRAVIFLIVFLVMALAGGYLLIDAGIIPANVKLPVNVINN